MIIAPLNESSRYTHLNKLFAQAFSFIESCQNKLFEPGKFELEGLGLIAICENAEGRGSTKALLEAHRKYIDIQYVFEN